MNLIPKRFLSCILFICMMCLLATGCVKKQDEGYLPPDTNPVQEEFTDGVVNKKSLSFSELSDLKAIEELLEFTKSNFNNEVLSLSKGKMNPNELVWAIVKVGDDSLVSEFLKQGLYDNVGEFAISRHGQSKISGMRQKQSEVQLRISTSIVQIEFKYSYTTLLNGFALKLPYNQIKVLQGTEGVKGVYLSEQYQLPMVNGDDYTFNEDGVFANDSGFSGEGMLVAVVDTGANYYHEVFNTPLTNVAYSEEQINDLVTQKELSGKYYNSKIVYGYDFADQDDDIFPLNDHGTHTSGIVAGDSGSYSGVAPKAQLAIMKVFSDVTDGAYTTDIIKALGECVLLGVDAINLSLGIPVGLSQETDEANDYIQTMYEELDELGIMVVCSAGNTYNGGFQSPYGGTLAQNPDNGVVSAPGSYKPNLSVASINVEDSYYLLANGVTRFGFNNAVDADANPYDFLTSFINLYGEGEFAYVEVPGIGAETDYENIDVTGKIALISRGTSSFEEKQHIAFQKGAIAAIIYNNVTQNINMQISNLDIPCISVSQEVGDILKSTENGSITVSFDNTYGKLISDFSSLGPLGDLTLKPEITAPGGGVRSASLEGYSAMSGTSMSSPNLAGLTLILKQNLLANNPNYTNKQIKTIINQLLMSTARIIKDENGNPVLVRKQGSGLADIKAALETPAYLTVTGSDKTKLELGDDPLKTGIYSLVFNLVNRSNDELTYIVNPLTMSEALSSDGITLSGLAQMLNESNFAVYVNNELVSDQKVKVNPQATVKIKVVVTLSETEKQELLARFANGIYVEGFVELIAEKENGVNLSIPWLAFLGDWTAQSVYDATIYDDVDPSQWAIMPVAFFDENYILPIGTYVFNLPEGYEAIASNEKYAAVSIFSDTTSSFYSVYFGLLRDVSAVSYVFTDANTNELLFEYTGGPLTKSYYNTSAQTVVFSGHSIDFNTLQNNLYNNSEILLTISAQFNYEERTKEEILTFKYTVDYEQPKMLNSSLYQEDDKTYLELEVYDNQYLQAIQLMSTNEDYSSWVPLDMPIPAYDFQKGYANTFTFDLTPYLDMIYNDSLGVYLYDFAMNPMAYEIDYDLDESNLPDIPNLPINEEDYEIDSENQLMAYHGTATEIMIPARVTKILANAFQGTSVEKVWFENGSMLQEVMDNAFNNSTVTHVYFHNTSLERINNMAFSECRNLMEVYFPNTVSEFSEDVFVGCNNLSYLNLENTGIAVLPNHLVMNNDMLTSIIVPATVNLVRNSFAECRGLTSIIMLSTTPPMMEGEFIEGEPNPNLTIFVPEDSLDAYLNAEGWRNLLDRGITIVGSSEIAEIPDMNDFNEKFIINDGLVYILNYKKAGITTYNEDDFQISSTGVLLSYTGPGGDIIIPSSVTSINQNVFYDNHSITSVTIQEGCVSIGRQAFRGCINLKSVTLPSTLTSLNTLTFGMCTSLTDINLEDTSIVFLTSVFDSNTSLKEIRFPKTLEKLSYSFAECHALKTVYFYSTKVTTNESGFLRNTNPTQFYVPYGYGPAYKLAWPNYAPYITEMEPEIPEGMLIENGVLVGYEGTATDLVIPIVVTAIADYALSNKNLTSVVFEARDLVLIGEHAFSGNNFTEIDLTPTMVTSIGASAFENCTQLEKVILPTKTLTALESRAFYNCQSLQDINLFNSQITTYEEGVLAYTNISRIVIPRTIGEIKDLALAIESLETVEVESPIPCQLADSAFIRPEFVIYVPTDTAATYQSAPGWSNFSSLIKAVNENSDFIIVNNTLTRYTGQNRIIIIPQNVTSIADQAFMNNTVIEEVVFPDGLEIIGSEAFSGCTALRKINLISSSVVEIGSKAFNNCAAVEAIKLPNTTYFIGSYAFYGCASLKDINLQNTNVSTLSYGLMQGCTSLPTLTIPASVRLIESYALYLSTYTTYAMYLLPKVPPVVQSNAFYTNPMSLSFRLYVLPGVSEAYMNAEFWMIFRNQTVEQDQFVINDGVLVEYLGSGGIVEIPSNVVSIGNDVFKDNWEITSVSIPSSVTSIGDRAFMNAKNLTKLEMRGKVPPQVGIDTFAGVTLKHISIPLGTLDSYRTVWSKYEDILEELETFHIVNQVLVAYYGDEEVVTIPDGVNSISSTAFNDNTVVREIFFPLGLTRIEDNAFTGCLNLETVHLPESLTYIGANAFYGCLALGDIVLGSQVNQIGKQAFSYSGLTSIDMSVTSLSMIEEKTFEYCRRLVEVVLPKSLTTIKQNAFYESNALEKVNFEETSLVTIQSNAFNHCNLLVITFPNTLDRIENSAFMYNMGLYEVHFSNSLTYIGELAFHYCHFVKELDLSNTKIIEIGREAFSEWRRLEKIYFPDTLRTINEAAFLSCLELEQIEIPEGVVTIGAQAFAQCSKITYVSIFAKVGNLGVQAFHSDSGINDRPRIVKINGDMLLNSDMSFEQYFQYNAELPISSYIIVDDALLEEYRANFSVNEQTAIIGVSEMYTINDGVLTSYNGPTNYVVVPHGVTTIGENVFENYSTMVGLTLSNTVEVVDNYAFKGCVSLERLNLGRNLVYLGDEAFANCYNLKDVRVDQVAPIALGKNVFKNCHEDMVIFVPENTIAAYQNAWGWKTYAHNIVEISDFLIIGNVLIEYNGNPTGDVVVPMGVKEIGEEAFNYYLIKSIVLPDGLTTINRAAFQFCNNLTSISLPSTMTIIDDVAFYNCAALIEITLNEGLLYLGQSIFSYCHSLTSVTIPSTVVYLGLNAFTELEQLETVIVNANLDEIAGSIYGATFGKLPALTTVIFNGNIGNIQGIQFYECDNLTQVIFNGSINSIQYASFTSLPKLEEVHFLGEVGEIADFAFNSNPALHKVIFGSSLGEIFPMAFGNCHNLKSWQITEDNTALTLIDNILYDGNVTHIYRQPAALETVDIYYVPETVKTIAPYAFSYYKEYAQIASAFYEMLWFAMSSPIKVENYKFKEIYFTGNMETIGEFAFSYHHNLEIVEFADSVTSEVNFGPFAYYGCNNLHTVIMPKRMGDFDISDVFGACPLLKHLVFGEDNDKYVIIDDVIYTADQKILVKFLNDSVSEFTVPEGVVKISSSAFINSLTLTKITLPSTLLVIGDKAFYGCENLTTYIFLGNKAPILETYIDQSYEYYYANFLAYLEHLQIELTLYCWDDSELYDSYIYTRYFHNFLSLNSYME